MCRGIPKYSKHLYHLGKIQSHSEDCRFISVDLKMYRGLLLFLRTLKLRRVRRVASRCC